VIGAPFASEHFFALTDRALDRLIGAMTRTDEVSTALPDLRAVRLDEMPALTPAALDKVVQRVLPGSSVASVLGTAFGSSI
jgi:hypothetical protein